MARFLHALLVPKFTFAVAALSSTPRLHVFHNFTTQTTSSSAISTLPPLFGNNNDEDYQNCTVWPLEYRTGYWLSIPAATVGAFVDYFTSPLLVANVQNLPDRETPHTDRNRVGTVFTIVDDFTNSTSISTQLLDQVTVTKCLPNCQNPTSSEIMTINKNAWDFDGGIDIGRTTTEFDSMKLLDGSWTTLTYPNGVLQITDSFYWRGTVSYSQDGTITTASQEGPSSAPGYINWKDLRETAWLPPSPLPSHSAFPNMTIAVDPTDPYGHNHVFMHNKECNLDMNYMLEFFPNQAMHAEWTSCKPPEFLCYKGMTWVKTVNYLLDTTVMHKGKKHTHTKASVNDVRMHTSAETIATQPHQTRSEPPPNDHNTRISPTRTPDPGSSVPHTTPKETKTTRNHRPAPTGTRSPNDQNLHQNTREDPVHTRVSPGHENDPIEHTRTDQPQHSPGPSGGRDPKPTILIGTDTVTQNSNSQYIYSGTTLTPGVTATFGTGPSATTIAISTRGQRTYIVSNGEISLLTPGSQQSITPEFLLGSKTLEPGSAVVISGTTYSVGPGGSTMFVNGHPQKITPIGLTWVTTLANGMLLEKTEVQDVKVGAVMTSKLEKSSDILPTKTTTLSELVLSSRTLLPGAEITLSGTTYSLGKSASSLYINGEPTRLSWSDASSLFTLSNGVVATETSAVVIQTAPSNNTSSAASSVTEASNEGVISGIPWLVMFMTLVLVVALV